MWKCAFIPGAEHGKAQRSHPRSQPLKSPNELNAMPLCVWLRFCKCVCADGQELLAHSVKVILFLSYYFNKVKTFASKHNLLLQEDGQVPLRSARSSISIIIGRSKYHHPPVPWEHRLVAAYGNTICHQVDLSKCCNYSQMAQKGIPGWMWFLIMFILTIIPLYSPCLFFHYAVCGSFLVLVFVGVVL